MKNKWAIVAILAGLCGVYLLGTAGTPPPTEPVAPKAYQAARAGQITYRLATPEDLKAVLGPPASEERERDGGMELLTLRYTDLTARFARMGENAAPFTLRALVAEDDVPNPAPGIKKGDEIDIGQDRPVELRSADDLAKFDAFWGFAGISLARLDLRKHGTILAKMPFDSRTQWPPQDKLPDGFDPARRIEEGKTPGLGVAGLHAQGIDGRGVGIAIIDQPLLRDHQEYTGRLVRYEPIDVTSVPPQMHGPPVCSIAVGRKCGVAPKAALYYYAVPMWKWNSSRPYIEVLEKIIELNKTLTDGPKIRAVSISLGMFSQWRDAAAWKTAVEKASENGILVVTCDPAFLRFGTLRRNPNEDPNDPAHYTAGRYFMSRAALGVPAGNRTTASHEGNDVYTYWVEGGMSWAVPYLAGLAALAFQVDPEVQPAQIVELWTATATKTTTGPVVNPPKFIEAVRSRAHKTAP